MVLYLWFTATVEKQQSRPNYKFLITPEVNYIKKATPPEK